MQQVHPKETSRLDRLSYSQSKITFEELLLKPMTIHSVPSLCNEAYSLQKAKCDPPQDFNNNNNNNNNNILPE